MTRPSHTLFVPGLLFEVEILTWDNDLDFIDQAILAATRGGERAEDLLKAGWLPPRLARESLARLVRKGLLLINLRDGTVSALDGATNYHTKEGTGRAHTLTVFQDRSTGNVTLRDRVRHLFPPPSEAPASDARWLSAGEHPFLDEMSEPELLFLLRHISPAFTWAARIEDRPRPLGQAVLAVEVTTLESGQQFVSSDAPRPLRLGWQQELGVAEAAELLDQAWARVPEPDAWNDLVADWKGEVTRRLASAESALQGSQSLSRPRRRAHEKLRAAFEQRLMVRPVRDRATVVAKHLGPTAIVSAADASRAHAVVGTPTLDVAHLVLAEASPGGTRSGRNDVAFVWSKGHLVLGEDEAGVDLGATRFPALEQWLKGVGARHAQTRYVPDAMADLTVELRIRAVEASVNEIEVLARRSRDDSVATIIHQKIAAVRQELRDAARVLSAEMDFAPRRMFSPFELDLYILARAKHVRIVIRDEDSPLLSTLRKAGPPRPDQVLLWRRDSPARDDITVRSDSTAPCEIIVHRNAVLVGFACAVDPIHPIGFLGIQDGALRGRIEQWIQPPTAAV